MSEFDWIDRYLRPIASSAGARGLRDDVAVLSSQSQSHQYIVTMDTLIGGVHFLPDDPPETLGQKIVRVNVSDILCKGALPRQAMLSVAIPDQFNEACFASFCAGLRRDLAHWKIDLIGGDLVSTPGPLALTLALTGETVGDAPIGRSGARSGDQVFVTGRIGAGHTGLQDIRGGGDSPSARHYRVPDVPDRAIAHLVSDYASASIDVSDGLIAECTHISEASDVKVGVYLDKVLWAQPVSTPGDALKLAAGGDDYQTLMTVPAAKSPACLAAAAEVGLTLTQIGEIESGAGVKLSWGGEEIARPEKTGYQHKS